MPVEDQFTQQVMTSLRKENRELETKNRSLQAQVAKLENNRLKYEHRAVIAEQSREALFSAVRLLSDHVKNDTSKERRARERARRYLESAGITPPGTLGPSRERKKTNKRKRKP